MSSSSDKKTSGGKTPTAKATKEDAQVEVEEFDPEDVRIVTGIMILVGIGIGSG